MGGPTFSAATSSGDASSVSSMIREASLRRSRDLRQARYVPARPPSPAREADRDVLFRGREPRTGGGEARAERRARRRSTASRPGRPPRHSENPRSRPRQQRRPARVRLRRRESISAIARPPLIILPGSTSPRWASDPTIPSPSRPAQAMNVRASPSAAALAWFLADRRARPPGEWTRSR